MEFSSISSSAPLDQDTVSALVGEIVEPQRAGNTGQELLYQIGETIFGAMAPGMVERGWSVYPQTMERRPGLVHGATLNWSKEHDLVHRLPNAAALKTWCSHCASDNVALVPGPASGNIFALDIDVLDEGMSREIADIADDVLGYTPFRREGQAPKLVLLYRQVGEERVSSVSRRFDAQDEYGERPHAIEILGDGRSVTIHGRHHKKGSYFIWLNASKSPLVLGPQAAPEVTAEKVREFLAAVEAQFPFCKPAPVVYSPAGVIDVNGLSLPKRAPECVLRDGESGLVVDGRWTWMKSVAWHAVLARREDVLAAQEAGGLEALRPGILAATVAGFQATAECRGRWEGENLTKEARDALNGAVEAAVKGRMRGCRGDVGVSHRGNASIPGGSASVPAGVSNAGWVADPAAADPSYEPAVAELPAKALTQADVDACTVDPAEMQALPREVTDELLKQSRREQGMEWVSKLLEANEAKTAEFKAAWDAKEAVERIAGRMTERRDAQDVPENAAAGQPDAAKAQRAALPRITVVAGEIERMVDEAEAALLASGRGLYQRGGAIVAVGRTDIRTTDGLVSVPVIRPLGEDAIYEEISSAAVFTTWDARKERPSVVNPPKQVIKSYLDRKGRWKLPVLDAVITAPTLRADGSILSTPGYDQQTGLFFDPMGVDFPEIADNPTREDAERALDVLGHSIATFPFVTPIDRAVVLAAELTAPVRRNFARVPAFVISAHTAGTGKTMLANIVGVIATGNGAALVSQGRSDEESEKILGGVLLKGAPVICVDNCDRDIGGSFWELMLTTEQTDIRPLGTSDLRTVSTNALLIATGNNAVIAKDMTRRVMLCTLDAGVERPEMRVFDFDPVDEAKRTRASLVWAALTILRAFHVAGRPRQAAPLGSFAVWSGWVRDALMWLGQADACLSIEAARETDPKLEAVSSVQAQWRLVLGEGLRVSARQIIEAASKKRAVNNWESEFVAPDFREALLAVAGDGGAINGRRLGKWLGAHAGRLVDGYRLEKAGISEGIAMWVLARV